MFILPTCSACPSSSDRIPTFRINKKAQVVITKKYGVNENKTVFGMVWAVDIGVSNNEMHSLH